MLALAPRLLLLDCPLGALKYRIAVWIFLPSFGHAKIALCGTELLYGFFFFSSPSAFLAGLKTWRRMSLEWDSVRQCTIQGP